ncbi:MAG TPA: serine/threonine-protein kinase [Kofleriaceae bacterium]|nr:serine/threonine-protein kinase [Kofleriaceae bacterium]
MTIPAGTLVPRDARDFGSYQLLAKIATGGMAEIYLARPAQAQGNKDVMVLKRILPHLAEDEHFVTMFRDEADLAAKLVHKNVCNVLSFGQYAGTWFIAMEYLHGVPLSRMMTKLSKAGKMLDFRVVAGIICQACEGLHSAHEARDEKGQLMGVVHRDVSPPNIMVTSDGTVKLLDFGIAKARGANSRTRTGTVKGKNAYMSPEQILGKPLDRRSDIFALGVVMYEMLAIKRLFHRDSDFLTFKAITEEAIPDIRDRRPDLPPGMRAALLQAMARDPAGRFDTAQGFGNAIKNSVATLGGPASPADLARLLFTDFGEEMSSRDEILKAADDPNAAPISIGPTKPKTPPPVPKRDPQLATSGEMHQQTPPRARTPTGNVEPGVIIAQSQGGQTGRVVLPDLANVLDLSEDVGADQWMAEGGTDLLSSHRWRSLRNLGLILVGLAVLGVGIYMFFKSTSSPEEKKVVVTQPIDAAVIKKHDPPPIDAPDVNKNDIVALSKFGFYTVDASAKTTIYVDNVRYAETPIQRLPLTPGPHKIKAVTKGKKPREFMITILGGRDTEQELIDWEAPAPPPLPK